ncbi:Cysteine dioxygenase [Psidium guajava]|nr:Cysteine dioxygenase [Psidium guajava]
MVATARATAAGSAAELGKRCLLRWWAAEIWVLVATVRGAWIDLVKVMEERMVDGDSEVAMVVVVVVVAVAVFWCRRGLVDKGVSACLKMMIFAWIALLCQFSQSG